MGYLFRKSNSSYYEEINNSILHSDGFVYAVGQTVIGGQQDFFLSKVSIVDGCQIYYVNPQFGSYSDILHGVAEAFDQTIVAVGIVGSSSNVYQECQYHGAGDMVIVRFDSNDGSILNIKTIGGSGLDRAYSVISLEDGSSIIAGKSSSNDFDFQSVPSYGGEDAVVIKVDYDFNIIWMNRIGSTGDDFFKKIIKSRDDTYLCVGSYFTNNKKAGLFCKVSPMGQILQQKVYESQLENITEIASITEDIHTGYLFLVGNYFSPGIIVISYCAGSFVIKTTFNGTEVKRINKVYGPRTSSLQNSRPMSFNDIIYFDNKLIICGQLPSPLRDVGIWVYTINLESLYESSYSTYWVSEGAKSILQTHDAFIVSGTVYSSDTISAYYQNSFSSAVYDSFMLKVKKSSALSVDNHIAKNSFVLFPNPVIDNLIIQCDNNYEKICFTVFNSAGQTMINGNFIYETVIQTSNFPQGLYIVKLTNSNHTEIKKIIKN